jgi:glc operon protein GlcG
MYVADSKRLTNEGAKMMMTAAIGEARAAGIAVSIAIADGGGHLILLERMERGRFHTVHSATTKAVCAASNKRETSAQGAQGQALDVAHALGLALAAGPGRWTAMEGGCPVIVDGECIGGVGVAGGDWATDQRIARVAVESIGARWACRTRRSIPHGRRAVARRLYWYGMVVGRTRRRDRAIGQAQDRGLLHALRGQAEEIRDQVRLQRFAEL